MDRKRGEGGEVVEEDEAWLGQCELMEVMGRFVEERGVGDRERRPSIVNCFHPKDKHLLSPTCGSHHPKSGPLVGARFMA